MQYNYTVKTRQGETQTGVVEANSERAALETLQARGFFVLRLVSTASLPLLSKEFKFFMGVKSKELVAFSMQLSTLVSAQVPLLTALQALARQAENHNFQEILFQIASDVEGGTLLSKALSRHPDVFSDFFINMVKSGEASGNLENSMIYLASYLERQEVLISKVRNAMIYPLFIMAAFLVIVVLMMVLVVPKLTAFLIETGTELPLVTRILIGASDFLQAWWFFLFVGLAGGGLYLYWAIKHNEKFRFWWDETKLGMPVFGKRIFLKLYVTRFAENLSTLIQGGLTILQSLQITADVVGNMVFQQIILKARDEVRVGGSLSESLSKHPEIPSLVCQMIATGEQSGSLDTILKKMANFYGKEIDNTVDNISQLIEPMLILMLGGGAAILVSAILVPIYSVVNSI